MATKSDREKSVYSKFNRFCHEHECKHAEELVKLFKQREHYEASYEQVCEPPKEFNCSKLGERINKCWLEELNNRGPAKANLTRVLFKTLAGDFLKTLCLVLFVRLLLVMAVIESLKRSLNSIEIFNHLNLQLYEQHQTQNISSEDYIEMVENLEKVTDESYIQVIYYVVAFFVSICAYFFLYSKVKLELSKCGLKCNIAMTQLIYNKSLRLHLTKSIENSNSRALSLISNEVTFIDEANKCLFYLIVGPLALIIATVWLATNKVGWLPMLFSAPFLLIFITVQFYLPKFYKQTSQKRKAETNKRIDAIGTFLSSIKVVKMYAWETRFKEKVDEIRHNELKYLRKLDIYLICDLIFIGFTHKFLLAIVFLTYIVINGKLDSIVLFTVSIVYTYFRVDAFYYFPRSLKSASDLVTACANIKQYLLLDEYENKINHKVS